MDTLKYIPPTAKELCIDLLHMMCTSNRTERIIYSEDEVDF